MKQFRVVAVVSVLLLGTVVAQDGRIEGRLQRRFEATLWPTKVLLIDAQSANVRSVTVEVKGDRFTFEAVKPGFYHLLAAGVKCYTGTPINVVVKPGSIHKVTLKLKFDSRLCEPITVD